MNHHDYLRMKQQQEERWHNQQRRIPKNNLSGVIQQNLYIQQTQMNFVVGPSGAALVARRPGPPDPSGESPSGPTRHNSSTISDYSSSLEVEFIDIAASPTKKRPTLDDVRFGAMYAKRSRFDPSDSSSSEEEPNYTVKRKKTAVTAKHSGVAAARKPIRNPSPQEKTGVINLCDSSDDSYEDDDEQDEDWEKEDERKPPAVQSSGRGTFTNAILTSGEHILFGINHSATAERRRLEQARGQLPAVAPLSSPTSALAEARSSTGYAASSPAAARSPSSLHRQAFGGPIFARSLVQSHLLPDHFRRHGVSPPGRAVADGVIDLCDADDNDDDDQGYGVAYAAAAEGQAPPVAAAAAAAEPKLDAQTRQILEVIQNSRRDLDAPYTLDEFNKLWKCAEVIDGIETRTLEANKLVRTANKRLEGTIQRHAQYGRLLPAALQKLFLHLRLRRADVFLDIGHGVGNAVLQAAYMVGCESKGIELVPDRNFCALSYQTHLFDVAGVLRFNRRINFREGKVELEQGALEDPQHRAFLTKGVTIALCNNFGDVFGLRCDSGLKASHALDDYLAGNFALMKEGARLVTLCPLITRLECQPLGQANKNRTKSGSCGHFQCQGNFCRLASFYEVEELVLGLQNKTVSWSEGGGCKKNVTAYIYTRVDQGTPDGLAVFTCANFGKCENAKNNIAIPAVQYTDDDKAIIGRCSCGFANKHLRSRKKAVDYSQWG